MHQHWLIIKLMIIYNNNNHQNTTHILQPPSSDQHSPQHIKDKIHTSNNISKNTQHQIDDLHLNLPLSSQKNLKEKEHSHSSMVVNQSQSAKQYKKHIKYKDQNVKARVKSKLAFILDTVNQESSSVSVSYHDQDFFKRSHSQSSISVHSNQRKDDVRINEQLNHPSGRKVYPSELNKTEDVNKKKGGSTKYLFYNTIKEQRRNTSELKVNKTAQEVRQKQNEKIQESQKGKRQYSLFEIIKMKLGFMVDNENQEKIEENLAPQLQQKVQVKKDNIFEVNEQNQPYFVQKPIQTKVQGKKSMSKSFKSNSPAISDKRQILEEKRQQSKEGSSQSKNLDFLQTIKIDKNIQRKHSDHTIKKSLFQERKQKTQVSKSLQANFNQNSEGLVNFRVQSRFKKEQSQKQRIKQLINQNNNKRYESLLDQSSPKQSNSSFSIKLQQGKEYLNKSKSSHNYKPHIISRLVQDNRDRLEKEIKLSSNNIFFKEESNGTPSNKSSKEAYDTMKIKQTILQRKDKGKASLLKKIENQQNFDGQVIDQFLPKPRVRIDLSKNIKAQHSNHELTEQQKKIQLIFKRKQQNLARKIRQQKVKNTFLLRSGNNSQQQQQRQLKSSLSNTINRQKQITMSPHKISLNIHKGIMPEEPPKRTKPYFPTLNLTGKTQTTQKIYFGGYNQSDRKEYNEKQSEYGFSLKDGNNSSKQSFQHDSVKNRLQFSHLNKLTKDFAKNNLNAKEKYERLKTLLQKM